LYTSAEHEAGHRPGAALAGVINLALLLAIAGLGVIGLVVAVLLSDMSFL
jgi:hypothetical protein